MNKLYPLAGMVTLSAVTTACQQADKQEKKQYNIVYIMTDDHTAQMMSCYDTRYMETPNLDRIANEGVRFTNSFVANSLSGPSRACMLTGKHSCGNKFYDNTTCVFDSAQQTFPKLLRKAGYQTAIIGKWHLESLPSGFDYWEIVPGQGDYYNPNFITQDNDTIQKHGYITNIITDDAIDWLEHKRDEKKPFCLMIHHKAIHRNWMADTCNLALYEDKTFPLPDNFFDDYEGREAAAAQEMSIVKDMDMIYDLKMLRPDKDSRLKSVYESFLGRLDSAQRAAWDKFYGPIIDDFYKKNPQGKELANWKFQRYMRDYMKTVKSLDDNVGRVLDYLKEKRHEFEKIQEDVLMRGNTLLRLGRLIVERQHDFFTESNRPLKPFLLRDAAQKLQLHESTISRAVSGKYLLYEGKVMELKEFFSRAVSYARENGENVSADEIQQKIRLIVEKEDKKNPLSDQKIVDKMKEEGLKVSRRTLAKYRERLGIPASSFRKRH